MQYLRTTIYYFFKQDLQYTIIVFCVANKKYFKTIAYFAYYL